MSCEATGRDFIGETQVCNVYFNFSNKAASLRDFIGKRKFAIIYFDFGNKAASLLDSYLEPEPQQVCLMITLKFSNRVKGVSLHILLWFAPPSRPWIFGGEG